MTRQQGLEWNAEHALQRGHGRTLARAEREISAVATSLVSAAELERRVKSTRSIHAKMCINRLAADQVLDTLGIRIIVPETTDCYRLIERIHGLFGFMLVEYDDYIQFPKASGYRSLHTTLLAFDSPVEVQVRTRKMHARAENGKGSHGRYKQRRARLMAPTSGLAVA